MAEESDSASRPAKERNPQAIAWYVEEAQRLLEDQQRRAESLRTRGGQIAGFGAAVLALIGGNVTKLLDAFEGLPHALVGAALLAAAFCLAATVAIAIWGALRPKGFAAISAEEIVNYSSEPFLAEQDLWRIHVRSLHMLGDAAANVQEGGNSAARAIEWSLCTFLAGLALSLFAIATLVVESI